jgi:hypothetical protein
MTPAHVTNRFLAVESDGGSSDNLTDLRMGACELILMLERPQAHSSPKTQTRLGNVFLALVALLLCAGCAHQPKHYSVPDSSKLAAASQKLAQKVAEARATNARASAAVGAAKASSDREGKQIAEQIVPKVHELLRVAPVELRPEIEALQNQVTALQAAHDETASHIADGQREQSTLTGQLEEATAAKNDLAKYSPQYLAEVDQLAAQANAAEQGWARDSRALWKLRSESWLHRLLGGLALLALGALGFLSFTGKLTVNTAAAAAGRVIP